MWPAILLLIALRVFDERIPIYQVEESYFGSINCQTHEATEPIGFDDNYWYTPEPFAASKVKMKDINEPVKGARRYRWKIRMTQCEGAKLTPSEVRAYKRGKLPIRKDPYK
jgi:hypothetical protein